MTSPNPLLDVLVDHTDSAELEGLGTLVGDMDVSTVRRYVTRLVSDDHSRPLAATLELHQLPLAAQLVVAHHLTDAGDVGRYVDLDQPSLLRSYLHVIGDRWGRVRHDLFAVLVAASPNNDVVAFLGYADGTPVLPRHGAPGPAPEPLQQLLNARLVADARHDPRLATWAQLERVAATDADAAIGALEHVTQSAEQPTSHGSLRHTVALAVTTHARRCEPDLLARLLAVLAAVDGHSVHRHLDTLARTLTDIHGEVAGSTICDQIARTCFGERGLDLLDRCTGKITEIPDVGDSEPGDYWRSRRVERAAIVTLAANPHVPLGDLAATWGDDDTTLALVDLGVTRRPQLEPGELIEHARTAGRTCGDIANVQLGVLCRLSPADRLADTIAAWISEPDAALSRDERFDTAARNGHLNTDVIAALPAAAITGELPAAAGAAIAEWIRAHFDTATLPLAGQLSGTLTLADLASQTAAATL